MATSMIYPMDLSCWMWMRWIFQQEVRFYQQRYDCSYLPFSVGNMLMKWSQDTVKYEHDNERKMGKVFIMKFKSLFELGVEGKCI